MRLLDKLETTLEKAVEPKYSQFDDDAEFQEILTRSRDLLSPLVEPGIVARLHGAEDWRMKD